MIVLVLNGEELQAAMEEYLESMKEILSDYQEHYTNLLWDNFCIVVTKWENNTKG